MYSTDDEVIDENELIQTNTDYKRDSFDDRVCDDLSEVLLSYLSFEDKFGFECISKQWKSLVFNKHKKLSFNEKNIGLIVRNDNLITKWFEDILMKCKCIDTIDINARINVRNRALILTLIIKHCNRLKSIRYDFDDIYIKIIESFSRKFGNSLQVLKYSWLSVQRIDTLLKSCNNLVSIKAINFYDLFNKKREMLLMTDKLEKFEINISFKAIKMFEKFIDKYKHRVKVASIWFYRDFSSNKFLVQLSKMTELKELHIKMNEKEDFDISDENLALVSNYCTKLEKLSFNGYYVSFFSSLQFKPISQLEELKYLSISLNLFRDENRELLSVKSFKDLKNLVHLNVKNVERSDDFYEDIDKYLPQLRVLKVSEKYKEKLLTDLTFNHLSKLTNIEILEIDIDLIFKVESFESLINNNKRLQSYKSIYNLYKQCFTNETIDKLISLAVKTPEIEFKFHFHVSKTVGSYWDQLINKPKNLNIDII